ncbi:UNVERIFIED_ORG: hypothetical protein M2348_000889 [Sphingomonas sp. R1F5B]
MVAGSGGKALSNDLETVANEAMFAGNAEALRSLVNVLKVGGVVALTGAGTSVPLAPAWSPFLRDLIKNGVKEGFVSQSEQAFMLGQLDEDPLELASALEESYTKGKFRAHLQNIFSLEGKSTITHEQVVKLPIESIITLNYDDGLSTAYVRHFSRMPSIIKSDDTYELSRWQHGQSYAGKKMSIIHWHGNVSSPDRIVITADDYNKFYGKPENSQFIAEVWRTKNVLGIGFGFRDPFFTRIAESVLRDSSSGNSHFALIGYSGDDRLPIIARRNFAKKYRLSPIFYKIDINADGSEDHSALNRIMAYLIGTIPAGDHTSPIEGNMSDAAQGNVIVDRSPVATARHDFEKSLLVGSNDRMLYVEPRLELQVMSPDLPERTTSTRITVRDIVTSAASYAIFAPSEHGGTTLARRLAYEIITDGREAIFSDAREMPAYKAKLLAMAMFKNTSNDPRTLIIDNISFSNHERLLKEVIGIGSFQRYIFLFRGGMGEGRELIDIEFGVDLVPIKLCHLQREDIRSLASQLYDTFDGDMISSAVEKTYKDLLDLCIPLTPSNIIMYLSVIYREGSFIALNRIQIMDKYIRDLLQQPSDAYRDAFNVDNKIDLLSSFVFHIFLQGNSTFNHTIWDKFCNDEMKRSLSKFDKDRLLDDLLDSRLIVKIGSLYMFKYKLFYSYLLGRHVGDRPDILQNFISAEHHLTVDSLVETIAGTSKDNTLLVTSLVERLEKSIAEFEGQYRIGDLDPYNELNWELAEDEEERVWRPVADRLANGPASDSEVDKVKRSIMAEQRTDNQAVIVREFTKIERSISYNQDILISAIRESSTLDGSLKVRSTKAIFLAYKIVMQIGFLFSPIIATRAFFSWNNVTFVNNILEHLNEEKSAEEKAAIVAMTIPPAVTDRAVVEMGSRKLGEVYKFMQYNGKPKGFDLLLLYSLIIRSKPEKWEAVARDIIETIERRSLYLRYLLSETMKQFREDVNSGYDRSALKRLVATIQAKRGLNKDRPTSRAIAGVLQTLEKKKYFDSKGTNN